MYEISLHRLIDCIFAAYPALGLTFMNKVDLAGAYICIWVRLEDATTVYFLVPREKDSEPQLVDFYLFITMGYIESAQFFCAVTKTVKDRALNTIHARGVVPEHPLESLAEYLTPERDTHRERQ